MEIGLINIESGFSILLCDSEPPALMLRRLRLVVCVCVCVLYETFIADVLVLLVLTSWTDKAATRSQ